MHPDTIRICRHPSVVGKAGIRNEDCGCIYSVHTPNFDIDEKAMQYGTLMYAVYAWEYLHQLPNAEHSETFKSVDELYHDMGRPVAF